MEYVVQNRPPGKSYGPLDLEKERLQGVYANLDKVDPKFREEFVYVFKTLKVMNERVPHIREALGKWVGEHNIEDAVKKLKAEAEEQITREAARAALFKAAEEPEKTEKRRK